MRVSSEYRSPVQMDGGNTAPTPTGFSQIVSDDFPVIHLRSLNRQKLAF